MYLAQVVLALAAVILRTVLALQQQFRVADDGVHGSTYVVTHVEEEAGLGHVGTLSAAVFPLAPPEEEGEDSQDEQEEDEHRQGVGPDKVGKGGGECSPELTGQCIVYLIVSHEPGKTVHECEERWVLLMYGEGERDKITRGECLQVQVVQRTCQTGDAVIVDKHHVGLARRDALESLL